MLQGHRTYPAFIHFLTCVVLMAMYMSGVAISGFYYAITNPMDIVGWVGININFFFSPYVPTGRNHTGT